MKCIIISENFKKALSLAERSTGRDLTLPILGSFLISAENGVLKIMATNLEIGIETTIRGTIQEQGRIAIPAKTLSNFISTLPKDEKIILESQKTDLLIQTQSQKTILKGYPQEDFPPFPIIKERYRITFKKTDIIRIVTKSLISVSNNNIKPELSSICFLFQKERVIVATTDSFQLSEEKIKPITFSSNISNELFLLPAHSGEELIKLLEYSESESIEFFVGIGEILIQQPETKLYSRLVEGKFPDYQQIIPKKFTTTAQISKNLLSGHIKRASIFTNKLHGVTLTFTPENNECVIESVNRDVGEYSARFKADVHGDKLTAVFNYHYLLGGIEGFSDETLFFGFNGESQPLVIHPIKKEDSLYIVMPMKGVT